MNQESLDYEEKKQNEQPSKKEVIKKIPADKFKSIMETILSAPPIKKGKEAK
jgi:hypothetical protein